MLHNSLRKMSYATLKFPLISYGKKGREFYCAYIAFFIIDLAFP